MMIDVQSQRDERGIVLQRVGIKNLVYPAAIPRKAGGVFYTEATVDLSVNLPADRRGTHMSRFVEALHKYRGDLSAVNFALMLDEIRERLDSDEAYGSALFPLFIEKKAPASGAVSMMRYLCGYEGRTDGRGRHVFVSVEVPVATVCPCSKAISDRGAHNQRGVVRARILCDAPFFAEDVIAAMEKSASCGLYSVLKREDEKHLTESAYDNPRFVEDVAREAYNAIRAFPFSVPCQWFSVEAESYESIHNHSAYALAEYGARPL